MIIINVFIYSIIQIMDFKNWFDTWFCQIYALQKNNRFCKPVLNINTNRQKELASLPYILKIDTK